MVGVDPSHLEGVSVMFRAQQFWQEQHQKKARRPNPSVVVVGLTPYNPSETVAGRTGLCSSTRFRGC